MIRYDMILYDMMLSILTHYYDIIFGELSTENFPAQDLRGSISEDSLCLGTFAPLNEIFTGG